MSPEILVKLRNTLANLYPDEPSIRRIIDDSGLKSSHIAFGSTTVNIWHSALVEANKLNLIDKLLEVIQAEYGTNKQFRDSCNIYYQSISQNNDSSLAEASKIIIPVRIFCVLSSFCSPALKELLIRQNQLQPFFDIGIANSWKYWSGRSKSEHILHSFQTNSRLAFCEKFQEEMARYNREYDALPLDGINVAITELKFPKNYYTWSTQDRKGVVIGISSLKFLFQDHPGIVQKIILRVTQRMLLYSFQLKGLVAHEDTRGCIFDLTRELTDISLSVDTARLCNSCADTMRRERGEQFATSVQNWLANAF